MKIDMVRLCVKTLIMRKMDSNSIPIYFTFCLLMKGEAVMKRKQMGKYLYKKLPLIFSIASCAGVAATGYLSAKNTPIAVARIKQAEEEKENELTVLEKIKVAAPAYIPTITVQLLTISAIIGANIVNHKQQIAIMSAYTFANKKYREYLNKIEQADEKLQETVTRADEQYKKQMSNGIAMQDDEQLFYDTYIGEYYTATIEQVLQAEYMANSILQSRGYLSVADYYTLLGVESKRVDDIADFVCWDRLMGTTWIDFNHTYTTLESGLECVIIDILDFPYTNNY